MPACKTFSAGYFLYMYSLYTPAGHRTVPVHTYEYGVMVYRLYLNFLQVFEVGRDVIHPKVDGGHGRVSLQSDAQQPNIFILQKKQKH